VTRPLKEWKGFRRIPHQPGENRMVEYTLTASELSYLSENMQRVVELGLFELMLGGSSADVQTAMLEVE
jgi:beta-glucosidase